MVLSDSVMFMMYWSSIYIIKNNIIYLSSICNYLHYTDEILLTMRRNAGGVSAVEGGPGVGDRRSAYYNVPVGSNSIGIANSTAARSRDPFLDAKADEKVRNN